MPKTCRNTRSGSHNSDSVTFDPTTSSIWSLALLSQLQSLTVAALQQELKAGTYALYEIRLCYLNASMQLPADATTQQTTDDSQSPQVRFP